MVRPTFLLPVLFAGRAFSQVASSVASQFGLSTSTTLSFPQATLNSSSTQSYITSKWGLSKGRIQNGGPNLVFVKDPFPNGAAPGDSGNNNTNSSSPVLQVQYPAGSFQDNNVGGAQFYAMWNSSGSAFQSMLVTYEVAFDADFDWVKGGKLPGLRGGPDPDNCSGGNQANGTNCFSSRVMWRTDGNGEVYAYVPRVNGICSDTGVQCNDQFGISLNRGSFVFASGQCAAIFVLHLVAVIDPRSKVESRYHVGHVKQPRQRRQWTGDTLFQRWKCTAAQQYRLPSDRCDYCWRPLFLHLLRRKRPILGPHKPHPYIFPQFPAIRRHLAIKYPRLTSQKRRAGTGADVHTRAVCNCMFRTFYFIC
ncbi:polysaccharide lyase family 14 protein [Russula decolorans]